jgi:hypothetical protein
MHTHGGIPYAEFNWLDYQAGSRSQDEIEQEILVTFLISSPQSDAGNKYPFIHENIFEAGKNYTLSGILILPYCSGVSKNCIKYL